MCFPSFPLIAHFVGRYSDCGIQVKLETFSNSFMGKPVGSWLFAKLTLTFCACPDLKNGHRNAHRQRTPGNYNDREQSRKRKIKRTNERKKNERKKEKENTLKAFFP